MGVMEVWAYGAMGVWQHGSMKVRECGSMGVDERFLFHAAVVLSGLKLTDWFGVPVSRDDRQGRATSSSSGCPLAYSCQYYIDLSQNSHK